MDKMQRRSKRNMGNWPAERVKALRAAYGETQDVFCQRLRVDVWTLRHWEMGRGQPSGPATIVLEQLEAAIAAKAS